MAKKKSPGSLDAEDAFRVTQEISDRITARAVLGVRYEPTFARQVISLLTDLETDLVSQIIAADVNGISRHSARRRRLQTLLNQTRAEIRDAYRRIRVMTQKELGAVFRAEQAATRSAVSGSYLSLNVGMTPSLPPASINAALVENPVIVGQPLREWWEGQDAKTFTDFSRQMRLGYQAGETVDQLVRRVRGGVRDGVRMKGVMDISRANAESLARTSVASIGNTARQAVYEANLDVIEKLQHLSRLDSRTSDTCIARSGKTWNAATKKPIDHTLPFATPPLHIRCRSVLVPCVVGADALPIESGDDWLKRISPQMREEVLGKGRARLFAQGDIGARDLVDQSGRSVTLRDLQGALTP